MINSDAVQLTILKDALLWIAIGLGLMGNVFGLIVSGQVKVGFVVTRLLFRLQFVWDALGCIILALYWITYRANVSHEILTASTFLYLWASFYPFILQNNLSVFNIVLITFDRFWSVVWFRTYPRNSKYYPIILISTSYILATICASTYFTAPFLITNIGRFGFQTLELYMKIQSIFTFVMSYFIPAVLVLVFQLNILFVLRNLKSVTLANFSSTRDGDAVVDNTTARNVRTASMGIIIIIVTFIVTRIYCQLEFVLLIFGLVNGSRKDGWQVEGIFAYVVNHLVNPFALIFTSAAARKWVHDALLSMASALRRRCTRA